MFKKFFAAFALVAIMFTGSVEAADHWVAETSKANIYVRDENVRWSSDGTVCRATIVCAPKYSGGAVVREPVYMYNLDENIWYISEGQHIDVVDGFHWNVLDYILSLR